LNQILPVRDIFIRSTATFIAGAVSSPISAIVFDVEWWKTACIAGLTAVVNLIGRLAQRWLQAHPES